MSVRGAYYNEHDPHAAQWLRNLVARGAIAPGDVDERDILDVRPSDLAGYSQHHFFAGIGVWSYALRCAGWPDDRLVWTGSCPCQPFSAAGKRAGFADERHLWPAWFWLIQQCRPCSIFGEQVASKDGLSWFDIVRTDLQSESYTGWSADLCAAGVGAPHIRQRLFFMANLRDGQGDARLEHSKSLGLLRGPHDENGWRRERTPRQGSEAGKLGHPNNEGWRKLTQCDGPSKSKRKLQCRPDTYRSSNHMRFCSTNDLWSNSDWLFCTDGKWRPVEPSTFPLAYGASFRMGFGGSYEGRSRAKMLKGYGNAIVAPLAVTFISDFLDWEVEK